MAQRNIRIVQWTTWSMRTEVAERKTREHERVNFHGELKSIQPKRRTNLLSSADHFLKSSNPNDTMKRKINHKMNGNGSLDQAVRFQFTSQTANTVSLAGTFNDWRPGAAPMVPLGNGQWVKELILPPGSYEYRLVVDNEWITDPLRLETAANPFGGVNSVVNVSEAPGKKNERRPSH